eukprot:PhM_4_TR17558/c0_g1_i1/m.42681
MVQHVDVAVRADATAAVPSRQRSDCPETGAEEDILVNAIFHADAPRVAAAAPDLRRRLPGRIQHELRPLAGRPQAIVSYSVGVNGHKGRGPDTIAALKRLQHLRHSHAVVRGARVRAACAFDNVQGDAVLAARPRALEAAVLQRRGPRHEEHGQEPQHEPPHHRRATFLCEQQRLARQHALGLQQGPQPDNGALAGAAAPQPAELRHDHCHGRAAGRRAPGVDAEALHLEGEATVVAAPHVAAAHTHLDGTSVGMPRIEVSDRGPPHHQELRGHSAFVPQRRGHCLLHCAALPRHETGVGWPRVHGGASEGCDAVAAHWAGRVRVLGRVDRLPRAAFVPGATRRRRRCGAATVDAGRGDRLPRAHVRAD